MGERKSDVAKSRESTGEKVWTISSPKKGKAELEYAIFDYRIQIYQRGYRHGSIVKVELHYVKAMLMLEDRHKILQSARLDDNFDYRRYVLLDDSFVTTQIKSSEKARAYFDFTVNRRNLMKQISDFSIGVDVSFNEEHMKRDIVSFCSAKHGGVEGFKEAEMKESIHILVEKFHRGHKTEDPCSWLLFHDSKNATRAELGRDLCEDLGEIEAKHMKRRVCVYFDAPLSSKTNIRDGADINCDANGRELGYKYSEEQMQLLREALLDGIEQYRKSCLVCELSPTKKRGSELH